LTYKFQIKRSRLKTKVIFNSFDNFDNVDWNLLEKLSKNNVNVARL